MGGVEEWRIKLTSAKVDVEVEAELGKSKLFGENTHISNGINFQFYYCKAGPCMGIKLFKLELP